MLFARWSSWLARPCHKGEVVGSSPTLATNKLYVNSVGLESLLGKQYDTRNRQTIGRLICG